MQLLGASQLTGTTGATASYNLNTLNSELFLVAGVSGGSGIEITMPPIAADGMHLRFIRSDANLTPVTITAAGSDLIGVNPLETVTTVMLRSSEDLQVATLSSQWWITNKSKTGNCPLFSTSINPAVSLGLASQNICYFTFVDGSYQPSTMTVTENWTTGLTALTTSYTLSSVGATPVIYASGSATYAVDTSGPGFQSIPIQAPIVGNSIMVVSGIASLSTASSQVLNIQLM